MWDPIVHSTRWLYLFLKNAGLWIWSKEGPMYVVIVGFIHSVFCMTTGPKPPAKRFLHIVRSRASSFKWEYPLLSVRSSSSFLRLLPCLLVTSISPFIFPSITCFRRQFLRKMWPIQLAFRFLISCRAFLCSLTLSNPSSFLTWSVQLIFSILLQHHISKLSRYRSNILRKKYFFLNMRNRPIVNLRINRDMSKHVVPYNK